MRFRTPLDDLFGTESKTRVLRTLFRHPGGMFTGRQLARIAKLNHASAHNALRELVDSGLVHTRIAGKSHLFSLNEKNHFYEPLKAVFSNETDCLNAAIKKIKRSLEKYKRKCDIKFGAVFGSVARGVEKPTSDIDLCIVVGGENDKEELRSSLVHIEDAILKEFGNALSPHIVTLAELRKISGKQVLAEIKRDGIVLLGEPSVLDRHMP